MVLDNLGGGQTSKIFHRIGKCSGTPPSWLLKPLRRKGFIILTVKVQSNQLSYKPEKVLASNPRIKHQIGPMFTTLEGELDEIMATIKAMQEAVFAAGALRVSTTIKIDERRDKTLTMEGKIKSLEEKLKD